MGIVQNIKANSRLKALALFLLMPANEARPRWWVRNFINPFYHRKSNKAICRSKARLDVLPFNAFTIGENSVIEDYAVVNNGIGNIHIGHHTFIGLFNVIIGPVSIGDNVIFAQNVVLSGLNHSYKDINIPIRNQRCTTAEIRVEDDCWIGANAVITAGVTIGRHSVIAAGSVVTKNIPPFTVAGGNPARILKYYDHKTGEWVKAKSSP